MKKRVHLAYPPHHDPSLSGVREQVVCSVVPKGQKWETTTDHSKVTCMNCRCTDIFKETDPRANS